MLRKICNSCIWFSVYLVAVCRISHDDCYVAKPYKLLNSEPVVLNSFNNNTWKFSFSLKEKQLFDGMDRDSLCRKPAMRVLKAFLSKNNELICLTSYHVKTILLHNLEDRDNPFNISKRWWPQNKVLGARVAELHCDLCRALKYKELKHYFVPEENLLSDINPIALDNMANRVKRLCTNKKEIMNILSRIYQSPEYSTRASTLPLVNPGWPQEKDDDEFHEYQEYQKCIFTIFIALLLFTYSLIVLIKDVQNE